MELDSAGGAAAFSPMQERDGRRSRGAGRLQLVRSGREFGASPDARFSMERPWLRWVACRVLLVFV
jgi:hypothetical protein